MKLYFYGHDYKYAAEQMLMTLFPGEKPEYPDGKPDGRRMELRMHRGGSFTTAACRYCDGSAVFCGRAAVLTRELQGKVRTDSLCQQILKLAIYRAVLRSGRERPPWGALTGVRPGKLLSPLLESEASDRQALKRFEKDYDVSHERALLCLDASRASLRADRELAPGDVCLYVGIPFCPTRCAYCSFVSQSVEKSMAQIPVFLEALEQEIRAVAGQVRANGLRVVSAYMGGGTPTTLSAEQLDRLLGLLEEEFDLSALRECTVEAGRPDTITEEKLRVLRRHAVDRVSVNPQTMSDRVLEAIGRKHSAEDILKALRTVRAVGGFAVNMDLIAGLPEDSPGSFRRTVDTVLALAPENITVHTLSIKRGARLRFGETGLPTDAETGEMLDYANAALRGSGYSPYYLYRQKNMSGGFENVGWTKPGYENLYNICIMEELCSILAVGAGGSTKLIRRDGGKNERLVAPKYPTEYVQTIDSTCENKRRITDFYRAVRESGKNREG
ncbi:MAG: coproporphyrinogen dehydrogenase HemZ [Oscillospiraceae bacterium]|nr:coproporphyrinogen dehydrogenase HemZ [Oscillospiraceae bacterium]